MNRKYLNYGIFILIVVLVVGLAVNHTRHLRSLVDTMANSDPSVKEARIKAAQELIAGEQFMDAITGETITTRINVVQALEDWATAPKSATVPDPKDSKKTLGPDSAVGQLVGFLKDPDKPVRDRIQAAILRVTALTDENLQQVVNGIKDGDPNVRKPCMAALKALGQSMPTAAAGYIPVDCIQYLRVGTPAEAATLLFDKYRVPAVANNVIPKIVDLIKAEVGARGPGGDVLGEFVDQRERSVQLLLPLMANTDVGIRNGAADALGKVGSASAIPTLQQAMNPASPNYSPQVRRVAIGAIAMIGDPSGESSLLEAMKNLNDDNEARAQAATGLGKIVAKNQSKPALDALIAALDDFDLKVRMSAVSALAVLGKPAIPSLLEALKSPKSDTQILAIQTLGAIADPSSNNEVIACLKSPIPEVRNAAATALGFMDNEAAIKPLLELLDGSDSNLAVTAANALAVIGQKTRPSLLAMLASNNQTAAYYASHSLSLQGQEAVADIARQAAQSKPSQRWAVPALGAIGGPEARDALIEIKNTADPETRQAADQQLKAIGVK